MIEFDREVEAEGHTLTELFGMNDLRKDRIRSK